MTFSNILILFIAAVLAGTLNSVAGGGSFITFPALIYTNVPPIQSNATNTVVLWPGTTAGAWGFKEELAKQDKLLLLILSIASLIGGVGGAILLLKTPQQTFIHLIPYLMLVATFLFAFSPLFNARLKRRAGASQKEGEVAKLATSPRPTTPALITAALLQLVISVYGGYFGGGIGILMLASLGVMGMENIHEMNAVKNALASCINGVAVITFIIYGAVFWADVPLMVVGAVAGGLGGAYFARKLDARLVRAFVIVVGTIMTIYFFIKYGIA